jgi:hypothetical protein
MFLRRENAGGVSRGNETARPNGSPMSEAMQRKQNCYAQCQPAKAVAFFFL